MYMNVVSEPWYVDKGLCLYDYMHVLHVEQKPKLNKHKMVAMWLQLVSTRFLTIFFLFLITNLN